MATRSAYDVDLNMPASLPTCPDLNAVSKTKVEVFDSARDMDTIQHSHANCSSTIASEVVPRTATGPVVRLGKCGLLGPVALALEFSGATLGSASRIVHLTLVYRSQGWSLEQEQELETLRVQWLAENGPLTFTLLSGKGTSDMVEGSLATFCDYVRVHAESYWNQDGSVSAGQQRRPHIKLRSGRRQHR